MTYVPLLVLVFAVATAGFTIGACWLAPLVQRTVDLRLYHRRKWLAISMIGAAVVSTVGLALSAYTATGHSLPPASWALNAVQIIGLGIISYLAAGGMIVVSEDLVPAPRSGSRWYKIWEVVVEGPLDFLEYRFGETVAMIVMPLPIAVGIATLLAWRVKWF